MTFCVRMLLSHLILLLLLCIVDTFMQFFRAYYDENGFLVFDLRRIRRNYLRGWFVVNLIASAPVTVSCTTMHRRPCSLVR